MPDDTKPRPSRGSYPFTRSNAASDPAARAPSNDPLAELARLIGQNDPLAEARKAPLPRELRTDWSQKDSRSGWPERDDPVWRQEPDPLPGFHQEPEPEPRPIPQSTDDIDRKFASLRKSIFSDPSLTRPEDPAPSMIPEFRRDDPMFPEPIPPSQAETDYGSQQPDGPLYGDNGQLVDQDPYDAEPPWDEPPPRRHRGLATVIAVLGLAVIGTAGAYGYRTVFSSGPINPPLIKADTTPNKVPASADGSGKQITDRVGVGGPSEKIVSREEQPVDVQTNARMVYPGAPVTNPSAASAATVAGWPVPPGTIPATTNAAPAGNPASPQGEPRKVKTVTIRADQQGGTNAPQAAQPSGRMAAAADSVAPARPRASAPSAPQASPLSINPQGSSAIAEQSAAAPPPPARSAAVASPPSARAPASGGGGYVVQISAQKSQDEASAAFRAAQARYPNVLGGRQLMIRRKEIAGKGTFYGAQVGPFDSRDEANQLCSQLKSAGGTCLVQQN